MSFESASAVRFHPRLLRSPTIPIHNLSINQSTQSSRGTSSSVTAMASTAVTIGAPPASPRREFRKRIFLRHLFRLLQDNTLDSMAWLPSGDAFCLLPNLYGRIDAAKFFQGIQLDQLVRLLQRFGFVRWTLTMENAVSPILGFRQEGFRQGFLSPDLQSGRETQLQVDGAVNPFPDSNDTAMAFGRETVEDSPKTPTRETDDSTAGTSYVKAEEAISEVNGSTCTSSLEDESFLVTEACPSAPPSGNHTTMNPTVAAAQNTTNCNVVVPDGMVSSSYPATESATTPPSPNVVHDADSGTSQQQQQQPVRLQPSASLLEEQQRQLLLESMQAKQELLARHRREIEQLDQTFMLRQQALLLGSTTDTASGVSNAMMGQPLNATAILILPAQLPTTHTVPTSFLDHGQSSLSGPPHIIQQNLLQQSQQKVSQNSQCPASPQQIQQEERQETQQNLQEDQQGQYQVQCQERQEEHHQQDKQMVAHRPQQPQPNKQQLCQTLPHQLVQQRQQQNQEIQTQVQQVPAQQDFQSQATSALPLPTNDRNITPHPVRTLEHPRDGDKLSPYQRLLRQKIEVFTADESEAQLRLHGHSNSIAIGQVGFRCSFCAHIHPNDRKRGASAFPTRLVVVYQAAQNIGKVHMENYCEHIPADLRQKMMELRRHRSMSRVAGKAYWGDCLRSIGLEERGQGIMYTAKALRIAKGRHET